MARRAPSYPLLHSSVHSSLLCSAHASHSAAAPRRRYAKEVHPLWLQAEAARQARREREAAEREARRAREQAEREAARRAPQAEAEP